MKTQNAILAMSLLTGTLSAAPAQVYLSPEYLTLSPDGKTLYVTEATVGKVAALDVETKKVTAEWALKANPSGMAVAADGTLYVTGGAHEGVLLKLDAKGKILGKVAVGHTPMAPVISADGGTVYVMNRFNNDIMAVNAATMKVSAKLPVVREPHAAALGVGGKLLFVANHLPYCRATDDIVSASVTVIDTAAFAVKESIMLPNGSTGVRGMCATPDGAFIYVTHTFGRYQLPTTQLERGWMNTAGLSVFNGETGAYVNTFLLDDVDLGAANPWGVTVTPDGKSLIVAHAGTREVSVIDRAALHDRLDKAARNEKVTEVTKSATDVPNDLSFLVTIRRRVKFEGDGPRGIVATPDGRVFAACYFADKLAEVKLSDVMMKGEMIALGKELDLTKDRVRRGEMLWNDGSMCFQQWQSCASCHPDARSDALNWDLVNDGIGNPKQSKNMVYSHLTPPTMVTGIRLNMETCNRKGMTHIQFVVRPEEDALCIDAFISSIKPVPSPYLVDGALSKAAKRGESLFKKAGCAECHPPDKKGPNGERLFTIPNGKKYLLLGVGNEEGREWDTTTLVETWRTAPYLYDGRALTMEEVLTTCNPDDVHGKTSKLKPDEIKDLAEYILSY
ncbi:MAG: c-type cytochrome [Kiritimatiellaeota bacterium]|nr:c-type cytochrome [Kiritimatiellota bacterium]